MSDQGDAGRVRLHHLDYLYTPSLDVAADTAWFADVLGARVVFAIEDAGTRVAMLELTGPPPRLLLADHLDGERQILVYRVADLVAAMTDLDARGWEVEGTMETHGRSVLLDPLTGGPSTGPLRAEQTRGRDALRGPARLLMGTFVKFRHRTPIPTPWRPRGAGCQASGRRSCQ